MRWLATGEAGIPEGTGWLSPVERVRLTRLRYTKPRTEYLLRRWAAKRAVAEALALSAEPANLGCIELLNHASGAPYVQVDGSPAGVDVSLTDRAGWAVVLVGEPGSAAGGTIGVDLELVEPRSSGFVADFLTGAEQAYVASRGACGQPGWDEAANLLWSAKEAVLKVRRTGLRADTRSVDVRVEHDASEDGWAAMEVVAAEGTAYPGWWRRDGQFLLTIAYRQHRPPPTPLPGGSDLSHAVPTHSWLAQPLVPPETVDHRRR